VSDTTLTSSESILTRIILAAGHRIMPEGLAGSLDLTLPSGRILRIGRRAGPADAALHFKSWRPLWSSMRKASIGFAESYMEGAWESPDPAEVIRFYLRNRDRLDPAGKPIFLRSLGERLRHALRRNDRPGARRNIAEHYDLGNAFYRPWLDRSMTYSSGYFRFGTETIEEAQHAKYRMILDALDLKPGHTALEIGCGWGGFAEAAARHGAQVTGITISREQLAYAQERLGMAGLAARLLDRDYRDTGGHYDRVVSIEMIEAVGERHWPDYFAILRQRMKPKAQAVIQAITIAEPYYRRYRVGADFIQRYIFPGGMLPTVPAMKQRAHDAGLSFEPLIDFGDSYARTLRLWRDRFEAAWPQIAVLGFDEKFRRMWRYYLAYCEAGFREGAIDVGLYRLQPV
jgi:cyclopropane-fatty-acyl-phospholipid synthase